MSASSAACDVRSLGCRSSRYSRPCQEEGVDERVRLGEVECPLDVPFDRSLVAKLVLGDGIEHERLDRGCRPVRQAPCRRAPMTACGARLALGESERRQRRPPSPNARSRSVSRASVARAVDVPCLQQHQGDRLGGRPRQRMLGGQPPWSSSAARNSSTASRGRPSATASSPRTKWTRRAGGLDLRAHGRLGATRPSPVPPEATLGHIDGRDRRQCRRGDGLRRPAPRLRDRDRFERASTSQASDRACGDELQVSEAAHPT